MMGRRELRPIPLPDPDVVFRPTRRDVDPNTREFTEHALWDHHEWQAHGECWLWCGSTDIEVTWIEAVQSSGMHAAFYLCRACLYELDQRVLKTIMHRDTGLPPTSREPAQSRVQDATHRPQ
ncbi:hypothetical protein [Streptomyces acidiscabies]|uniref:Uncharacterized protein n=2 Tax=Streptomyces acidiscabies TaxID=42234 RepID=A0AAP6BM09_9ACTN|nr:hypothetical protein [Streptomyces acidiscabies]MDX2967171.1 hypothetical protein [Streptomyces acidiscabies]MDX3025425.1 hypothetical protein [Streptomyces acidiscabies]MDX3795987.1 hypothetical protein [Streptomyces acidiscabies]